MLVKDTLKSITENTSVSFGLMLAIVGGLAIGYNKVWETQFKAEANSASISRLETKIADLEHNQNDIGSMKTDIAVIKNNLDNLQKSISARK